MSVMRYCHFFPIFMADVDPVEFIKKYIYFTQCIFTRGTKTDI